MAPYDCISKQNAYDPKSTTYYPVAIIGAGESGIAMACRLKEALGFDQFRLFDRQSGLGGTWYINRYPGVACDVPAIFYSFSFCQNPYWSKFYPSGPEIIEYLQGVCRKYQIMDKIQLNTEVKECRWNQQKGIWDITLQHLVAGTGDLSEQDRSRLIAQEGHASVYLEEEIVQAKVVISAVGILVEPKVWPDSIPGKSIFKGEIFHSARWRYDIDLTDKNVIVIGTGCSAAQFVPRLSKMYGAKSVTQIMRTPPWIVPKSIPPMGTKNWEKYSAQLCRYVPGFNGSIRFAVAALAEWDMRLFWDNSWSQKERVKYEQKMLAYLKQTAPAKYLDILTPNYSVGCKRRIFDQEWLQSLHDPKIELTTYPLVSLGENSARLGPYPQYPPQPKGSDVAGEAREVPADVIILANGFETTKWLHPLKIVGSHGRTLDAVYEERGGPQMYMGSAIDGFPNFFALFGPNTVTGHSSVILASENMVEMTLKLIKPILQGDVSEIEIKREKEIAYTNDIQKKLKATVWHRGGCTNWYKDSNDWDSTAYPYTQIRFAWNCLFPTYSDWDFKYTRSGLIKHRLRQAANFFVFMSSILGTYHFRKTGLPLTAIPLILKMYLRLMLSLGGSALMNASKQIRV